MVIDLSRSFKEEAKMFEILKKKVKDLRIMALSLVYIGSFLNIFTMKASDGEGACTLIDIVGNRMFMSGKILFLIPVVIIACMVLLNEKISDKVIYLTGGVAGLLSILFIYFVSCKRLVEAQSISNPDVRQLPGLGLFIEIAVWLFIIVWTLIKDFGITKDSIKDMDVFTASKSIKDTLSDISDKVSEAGKVSCPSCGRKISASDMFCTYCGSKISDQPEKDKSTRTKDRVTVEEYIKGIKDYSCEICGEKISGRDKYCPGCGNLIVIKEIPDTCSKCGYKLSKDFVYCPKCATKIEPVELRTKCSKCGADLIYGKGFCVCCGTKVDEN